MSPGDKGMPPLIMLGAGGHAKVLLALAQAAGLVVQGVCDPGLAAQGERNWRGLPVLGGDEVLDAVNPESAGLINGIGQLAGSEGRWRLYDLLRSKGFRFPALVHPAAWVAPSTRLGEGAQIMAGAIVQPDCSIGENSIVNTRASIDHDCQIGTHVHVAPAATLCGGVIVGSYGFIGSGAAVIQGVHLGENAIVGAGTTLVKNLPDRCTVIGPRAIVRERGAV